MDIFSIACVDAAILLNKYYTNGHGQCQHLIFRRSLTSEPLVKYNTVDMEMLNVVVTLGFLNDRR